MRNILVACLLTLSSHAFAECGYATHYGRGDGLNGHRTANGERLNIHAMTAAHRRRPFNTHVNVINMHNGRSVTVRINDRGPFVRGAIIDLTYGAARQIGALSKTKVCLH